ncbi:hypothetical protein FKM82_006682 [Ascaphus truei]
MFLQCIGIGLVFIIGQCKCISLLQPEMSLTKPERRSIRIACKVEGVDIRDRYIHWYRQEENKGLEWIMYFKDALTFQNGEKFGNKFSMGKNQENEVNRMRSH